MVNPFRLNKKELLLYTTGKCRHRHSFLEHPSCFDREQNTERVGFLDIETNSLFANFGIMIAYSIKDKNSNKIYGRSITSAEMKTDLDKSLLIDCVNDMNRFDRLITYNGCRFDIPFVRTRCLKFNLEFPLYKMIKHDDVYFMARSKLRLHRKSLDVVSRFFGIEGKTHVDGDKWVLATLQHNKKYLDEIFEHNKNDVLVLEKVYNLLKDFSGVYQRSI